MILIGLYFVATILLLVKIEPLTFAGVFLSIFYLPGLSLFVLFKKNRIVFEDLVLAFPCSIGLSSIMVLGFLSLDIQVRYIPIIIHLIAGIIMATIIFAEKKRGVYFSLDINKQEVIFSFFALIVIFLLSIPFFLGPNRVGISGHAFHHSIMVTQIINGIFPPENPGLGGTAIGYYWGFHALIAAFAAKTNIQQIEIMFILNAISLFFIFCISYCFIKAFDLSQIYSYILPLAIMGIMRADAGIIFLVNLFAGKIMSLESILAFPIEPIHILHEWIKGLPFVDTRLFFLRKLYNISGMLMALSLCLAYLFVIFNNFTKDYQTNRSYIACIILIVSACFFNYPPLAVFLLIHAPVWTCYLLLYRNGKRKNKISEALKVIGPFIIGVLIASPYMLYIVAGRSASSSGQGGIFSIDFYNQSLKNMILFLGALPVIVYGAMAAVKKMSFSREFNFLLIGTALCLCLTIFTRWPFDNSYKYNYILTFFFAVFFVFGLSRLLPYILNLWLKRLTLAVIFFFLLLTPVLVETAHVISSFSTDHIYSFPGRHIEFAKDYKKNEAYIWIRDNTPSNALLMLSYTETNWPCCAFNNNYQPAALSERTLYVIKDRDYTISNPEYAKRILFREKLFANPQDESVIDYFNSLNRPIYLLIEKGLDESKYFVEERFAQFPDDLGKEFVIVFQNERQRVYHIRFNK